MDLGDTHELRFGTLLATGPTTSLRAAFSWARFDKPRVGSIRLPVNDQTTGLLEFGASIVLTDRVALDVLLAAGLTRNAPDFQLSVALPIRF